MKRSKLLSLLLACLITVFMGCSRGSEDKSRTRGQNAVPVTVGLVSQKVVPMEVSAIGKGEAYMTISVKSRIAGQVIEVDFKEGQDVKKGHLLYKMDCRALEAQLAQAEATLAGTLPLPTWQKRSWRDMRPSWRKAMLRESSMISFVPVPKRQGLRCRLTRQQRRISVCNSVIAPSMPR